MENSTHVLMFPGPFVTHLISPIKFAQQILRRNTNISFTILLMRAFVPGTPDTFQAAKATVVGTDKINLIQLPHVECDGIKLHKPVTGTTDYTNRHLPAVADILKTLCTTSTVSAFIVDIFSTTFFDLARELNIPAYIFCPASAAYVAMFLYTPSLDAKSEMEFRDWKEGVEFPGMSVALPPLDLPTNYRDRKDEEFEWTLYHGRRYKEAEGILINTFDNLEPTSVNNLRDGRCLIDHPTPAIYPVGPLLKLESYSSSGHRENGQFDNHECIKWLNDQPARSVIFVCFGSFSAVSVDQVHEIVHGLELSGYRFLLAVRVRSKDVVEDFVSIDEILPCDFKERIHGHGLVWPTWVPQTAILSHDAVGGFVSHCGWNSCLESIWFGVPVIAWPSFGEQRMNAFELVVELGLGIRLKKESEEDDAFVTGEELAKAIKVLMEGEEGKRVKENTTKMKELGRMAMDEGGSSYLGLDLLARKWSKD